MIRTFLPGLEFSPPATTGAALVTAAGASLEVQPVRTTPATTAPPPISMRRRDMSNVSVLGSFTGPPWLMWPYGGVWWRVSYAGQLSWRALATPQGADSELVDDGGGPPPKSGPVEQHPRESRHGSEDKDQPRDAQQRVLCDVRDVLDLDDLGRLAGDLLRQPTRCHHHRQSHDERCHPPVGDEHTVHQPGDRPDQ